MKGLENVLFELGSETGKESWDIFLRRRVFDLSFEFSMIRIRFGLGPTKPLRARTDETLEKQKSFALQIWINRS